MHIQRINSLRSSLDKYLIDGYIVPTGDEYLSEYTADYAKRLQYITGFTGSNGMAIILKEQAYCFTDGRYLEQANQQLNKELFEIYDLKDLNHILATLQGSIIGYDPKLFTIKSLNQFSYFKLAPLADNLIDQIWQDKPTRVATYISIYPDEYAGRSYLDKLEICYDALEKHRANHLVLTKSDTICWLLNIRGDAVPFSPLILGTCIISKGGINFFTNCSNAEEVKAARPEIILHFEEELPEFLSNITTLTLIDEENTNSFIVNLLTNKKNITDPCVLPKACKNEIEIKGFIQGHIYDGAALCEFLYQLESLNLSDITEYDIAQILSKIRSKQPLYLSDSFPTICGFAGNGSIIHYNPAVSPAKKIIGDGLLLIDSGAHYMGATTDVTRVVAIGEPTAEQKKYYTKVLKGHIALAKIKFPCGVSGCNLDVLARQFLWSEGMDYAHGTGHGVGSSLSVHEGPQSINLRNNISLQHGMVLSNEPGYYKQGEYGIRIENLMYVETANMQHYLQFKTLTLAPYEKKLIDFDLIAPDELSFIENYYQEIEKLVYPLLSSNTQKWLLRMLKF